MASWLTDEEVKYTLEHGQLQLSTDLSWRTQGRSFKLIATVANAQDLELLLVATMNPRTDRFSFSLCYPSANQALRRFCSRGVHKNPGERRASINGKHKHTWDARTEDHAAYVPTDITSTLIVEALGQFLAECHVVVNVGIPDPPDELPRQLGF